MRRLSTLCCLSTDYQLEIIYIVNDYRAKHQPLTELTTQYSLLGDPEKRLCELFVQAYWFTCKL